MRNQPKSTNPGQKQEKKLKYINQTANNQLQKSHNKRQQYYLSHAPIFSDFQIFI